MPQPQKTPKQILPGSVSPRDLLDAALELVENHGISELTLRKLAAHAGISIATVTHHLGSKDELMAGLVRHATTLDAAVMDPWQALALGSLSAGEHSWLAAAAARNWTGARRGQAVLYAELIRTGPHAEIVGAALREWDSMILEFWAEISGNTRLGGVLHAFLVDETAFDLALGDRPAYAALRQLNIDRLVASRLADLPTLQQANHLFAGLVNALAPDHSVLESVHVPHADPKRAEVAAAAAKLIVDAGIEAVTHRSVAAASGHSPSTVVYFFGARSSLITAGLEDIVRDMHARLRATGTPGSLRAAHVAPENQLAIRPIVRATNEIAVAAIWQDRLKPHAADMRRRRGENITPDHLHDLPALARMHTPLIGQILSVAMFGARLRAVALGQDPASAVGETMGFLHELFSEQSQ